MRIPVYEPQLTGNESRYVQDCLDSTWISSKGQYLEKFEAIFSDYVGMSSTTVSNGTVALHLALLALDICPGDEVIVPSMTYIATVNAIKYVGATPVFIDCDSRTWQADPAEIKKKISQKTRAVLIAHLYGSAAKIDDIAKICQSHQLYLIEDCAEALGTFFFDRHVGIYGDIATFSFYGNKTITTGEGGMISSKNPMLIEKCVKFKNQGLASDREYWHDVLGYNYRMTNLQAAIGYAQMEQISQVLQKKREIASRYKQELRNLPVRFQECYEGTQESYWMISLLAETEKIRDSLRAHLKQKGIETRPLFPPVHKMPIHYDAQTLPITEGISKLGMNIPSFPGLLPSRIEVVTKAIQEFYLDNNS